MTKSHSSCRTCLFSIYSLVALILVNGCNSQEIATPTAVSPEETLSPMGPTHFITQGVPTSTAAVALVPSATPQPTAIIPQPSDRALLVSVGGMEPDSPEEIWVLEAGETTPHPILQSKQHSFEHVRWSNSGEWIAFQQRDISGVRRYEIGVVRKDGTEQHLVTDKEFPNIFLMNWSSSDRWLTFIVITPQGNLPYAIEVSTGVITNLLPRSDAHYTDIWLQPSLQADVTVLIGLIGEGPSSQVEMWLVPLESGKESVRIPVETWPDCEWFTGLSWSPDGKSFLVQPGNDDPKETCPPRLWLYDLEKQTWSQVAQPPEDGPRYLYLRWVDWSPDHRWVAWLGTDRILVYDTVSWSIVREQKMHGTLFLLTFSWVQDRAGNSILTIGQGDYAIPPKSFTIVGLSPNGGNGQADKVLAEILREPDWLPENSDYLPLVWQP